MVICSGSRKRGEIAHKFGLVSTKYNCLQLFGSCKTFFPHPFLVADLLASNFHKFSRLGLGNQLSVIKNARP